MSARRAAGEDDSPARPQCVTRAAVGDRVLLVGTRPGTVRRDGVIVGLHHPDGRPPYDVRWSDTDHVTVFFPGPDARIHHYPHPRPAPSEAAANGAP